MIWANFAVLGLGGALLTLPVILHFLMQPKPKVLEFPALRFVKELEFTNRSRVRLRHFLLMLLRCLLIGLMAAALAGPSVASRQFGQWITLGGVGISALVVALSLATVMLNRQKRRTWLTGILAAALLGHLLYGAWATYQLMTSDSAQLIGDSAAPVTALVVVDTSCRMGYQHENKTNLERAQEISRWLVDQFPADSQVAVLATNDEVPFFSVDLGAARNRLENLEFDFVSNSVPQRFAQGLSLFDDAIHERKEVYLVSDLTKRSWRTDDASLMKRLELEPAVSVFVVDVGLETVNNFSLAPLELNQTSLSPGSELVIASSVSRSGAGAQRNVRFRLERQDTSRPVIRDGNVLVPETIVERSNVIDIPRNGNVPVEFRFSEPLGFGIHHGSIEIVGEDSLPFDNQRYFTLEVRPTWEVLVVHGDQVSPDNLTEALIDDATSSTFNCTIVSQRELPNNFKKYDAVFFLDPQPGISDTTWSALRQYVATGRGLGIFLGNNAAGGAFGHETFQSDEAQKILTGKLDRQWRRPDAKLSLSPGSLTHPIFTPFRDWETAVPWDQFPIFIHWSIEPDNRREEFPTQTVLQYGNGKPAIIERQIGEGRVMVMTTPITETASNRERPSWNYLFSGTPLPGWLLVRKMSEYLVQSQADRLSLTVGEIAKLKNDVRKYPIEYRIFTPRTNRTPERITASENVLRYRFTGSPGQYRLKGKMNQPILRGFSANLGDGETDLSRMDPPEVDAVLGAGRYQLANQQEQIQRQQGTTRRGQEFYPLLVLMLVVVLGLEYLMSNRFYS